MGKPTKGAVGTGFNGYSHDRRDETATPLCGAHRVNTTNPLLQKSALGCVQPTVYNLPSATNLQHAYGLPQERDGSCSAEVLGEWASHDPEEKGDRGRDFMQLNKSAVVSGVSNNKGITQYRNTHDFRLKLGEVAPKLSKGYDETTTFGRPTVSGESFNDLFCHSYRFDWVSNTPAAADMVNSKKPKKPGQTKSSLALAASAAAKAQASAEEAKPEYWKMQAFTSIPPRVGRQG